MPYPQYNPYMPQPQQPRRLNFVAGEEGMRSFVVNPGDVVALFDTEGPTMWLKWANEIGVPDSIAYTLTERPKAQPKAEDATDARLSAMEQSIAEMKEALDALAVPDVRAGSAKPRHAGRGAGDADGERQPDRAV